MIFSIDTGEEKINGNNIMTLIEKSYQKVYRTAFMITQIPKWLKMPPRKRS